MSRSAFTRVLALFLCFFLAGPLFAQDEESATTSETEAKTGRVDQKKFPLYLEVQYGNGSSEEISNPLITSSNISRNSFSLEDFDNVRASIGWALDGGMDISNGRGRFRIAFEGFKETEFAFQALGRTFDVFDTSAASVGSSISVANNRQTWWIVNATNGSLVAVAQRPTWDSTTDDANNDGFVDDDELTIQPLPNGSSKPITETLQNQIQTADFLYERTWGKRRFSGSWGGGLRYLHYKGNVPVAAWIRPAGQFTKPDAFVGYTNGISIPLIPMSQDTSGIGPTGYGEMDINLLEGKVQFYGQVRAAFLLMNSEIDSGEFLTLVGTGNEFIPARARLQDESDKDSWNTGIEFGSRIRIAEGLQLHIAYYLSSYQDVVVLPRELTIPELAVQIDFGTTATYGTRDFKLDGWRAGFSFQY